MVDSERPSKALGTRAVSRGPPGAQQDQTAGAQVLARLEELRGREMQRGEPSAIDLRETKIDRVARVDQFSRETRRASI
jgi:hypothetical protein